MSEAKVKKILVIDDEEDFTFFIKANLEQISGYKVIIAKSGKGGLEIAAACIPDLILLDIQMPDVDGFYVLRKLNNDPTTVNIPVVMLTINRDTEAIFEAEEHHVADYIMKPFTIDDLLAKVKKVLQQYR